MRLRDMIYVLGCSELKNLILRDFNVNTYSAHLRYQKILTMVKKFYYWLNLKKELVDFLARCLDCQQVKVECNYPCCALQAITILEWKWEVISMDFITGLSRTVRQHDFIMSWSIG